MPEGMSVGRGDAGGEQRATAMQEKLAEEDELEKRGDVCGRQLFTLVISVCASSRASAHIRETRDGNEDDESEVDEHETFGERMTESPKDCK